MNAVRAISNEPLADSLGLFFMQVNLKEQDFLFLRSLKANHFKLFLFFFAAFFVGAVSYILISARFWQIFLDRSAKTIFHLNGEISQCGFKIHFVCVSLGFFWTICAHFLAKVVSLLRFCVERVDFSQEYIPRDKEFDKSIPLSSDFLESSANLRLKAENAEAMRLFAKYRVMCALSKLFWMIISAIHCAFAFFLAFFEKTSLFFQRTVFCAIFSAAFAIAYFSLTGAINRHFSTEKLDG